MIIVYILVFSLNSLEILSREFLFILLSKAPWEESSLAQRPKPLLPLLSKINASVLEILLQIIPKCISQYFRVDG